MIALVISLSQIAVDPRVRRQVNWLVDEGWTVDTIGLGDAPIGGVRKHFEIARPHPLARSRGGKALIHTLFTYRVRFNLLTKSRIPPEAGHRVARGEYDLIVFNDFQLLPWILDPKAFPPGLRSRLHLDLHEYRPDRLDEGAPFASLVGEYYSWTRRLIGSDRWTSRSVVASGIGDLYVAEFGIPPLAIVRNAPAFEELEPSPTEHPIELIHHGIADPRRGMREAIEAIRELDDRFRLNLMLVGHPDVVAGLKEIASDLGDRVRFLPPARMEDLSQTINRFDLEVMFYPPLTENLQFALPNKLFEAVQGRLGLVIGPSPMMREIVDEYGNGVVATGWTSAELADVLRALDLLAVAALKNASHRAAHDLSAEHERMSFLLSVGAAEPPETAL